ncbi:MAG: GatB/YqeY domain-containing protein [Acidobacteria bacterium]|nr:GatB/YqeY domain-containing protein [Acidobacteriota bacterium]
MLELLLKDLKSAMLAQDGPRTQVLRMFLAAYRNEAVAKNIGPQGILAESDALALVKRLVKSREESVEQYTRAGYPDRAESEKAEILILKEYLPAMLEGEALEAAVREAVSVTGAATRKDLGKVMKHLQAVHGGAFDGKAASQIAQSLLPQ